MKKEQHMKWPKKGTVSTEIYEKGRNEFCSDGSVKLKNGDIFFTVWTEGNGSGIDTLDQMQAEAYAALVRVEAMLKKIMKKEGEKHGN